jgi:hypothetical protein
VKVLDNSSCCFVRLTLLLLNRNPCGQVCEDVCLVLINSYFPLSVSGDKGQIPEAPEYMTSFNFSEQNHLFNHEHTSTSEMLDT